MDNAVFFEVVNELLRQNVKEGFIWDINEINAFSQRSNELKKGIEGVMASLLEAKILVKKNDTCFEFTKEGDEFLNSTVVDILSDQFFKSLVFIPELAANYVWDNAKYIDFCNSTDELYKSRIELTFKRMENNEYVISEKTKALPQYIVTQKGCEKARSYRDEVLEEWEETIESLEKNEEYIMISHTKEEYEKLACLFPNNLKYKYFSLVSGFHNLFPWLEDDEEHQHENSLFKNEYWVKGRIEDTILPMAENALSICKQAKSTEEDLLSLIAIKRLVNSEYKSFSTSARLLKLKCNVNDRPWNEIMDDLLTKFDVQAYRSFESKADHAVLSELIDNITGCTDLEYEIAKQKYDISQEEYNGIADFIRLSKANYLSKDEKKQRQKQNNQLMDAKYGKDEIKRYIDELIGIIEEGWFRMRLDTEDSTGRKSFDYIKTHAELKLNRNLNDNYQLKQHRSEHKKNIISLVVLFIIGFFVLGSLFKVFGAILSVAGMLFLMRKEIQKNKSETYFLSREPHKEVLEKINLIESKYGDLEDVIHLKKVERDKLQLLLKEFDTLNTNDSACAFVENYFKKNNLNKK